MDTPIAQVRWSFEVRGQPPTVNHLYVRKRGGGVAKAPGVEAYQTAVFYLCRDARPSGWRPDPTHQIRIMFSFFLGRDADCDNLLKSIQDAVALALGINDRMFIPCVISKETGCKDPYTKIEIYELL